VDDDADALDGQVLATTEVVMITVEQGHFETHAQELLGRDARESSSDLSL
jgi:hypothetical protein